MNNYLPDGFEPPIARVHNVLDLASLFGGRLFLWLVVIYFATGVWWTMGVAFALTIYAPMLYDEYMAYKFRRQE